MQKVEGSSPFSRSLRSPAPAGFSVARAQLGQVIFAQRYHRVAQNPMRLSAGSTSTELRALLSSLRTSPATTT